MTVAVGFMCFDGLVLAADREVSTSSAKIDGPKAWHYWYPRESDEIVLRVGIAGAGDYAFIKFASELIDDRLTHWIDEHGKATLEEVGSIIQGVVNDVHHNHLYPVGQPHERPTIDLLIGIWLQGGIYRLVRSSLTAITKVSTCEAAGIGSDLANFIVRRAYIDGRIPMSSAIFWAIYVLMHAKHYVPGCGGPSDVIPMFKTGSAGKLKAQTVQQYEQFVADFEMRIQPVFLGGVVSAVTPERFQRGVEELTAWLRDLRPVPFMERQAERVHHDIAINIPTGDSQVVGEWISAHLAQGLQPQPSKPEEPTKPDDSKKED